MSFSHRTPQGTLRALLCCLLLAGCSVGAERTTIPWEGIVHVYGSLRAMMHEGQTGAQVRLDTLLPDSTLYAVGALADLAGEVTVVGGTAYLAHPSGRDSARTEAVDASDVGACLLVTSQVESWRTVTTTGPIAFEALDDSIASLAAAAGMDLETRFPFLLEGTFEDLAWHVIDGTRLTGNETSHLDHLKAAVRSRRERTPARLVGFYSQHDERVFTHMGSSTHIHCVLAQPLAAGHVDHVNVPAGTVVKFPD